MDQFENPYRPGAGIKPGLLAGRSEELGKAEALLRSVQGGAPQRPLMLYGLRGVGKTVLLNEMERTAERLGFQSEYLEMSEKDDFRRVIAKSARKVLLKIDRMENLKSRCLNALGVLKGFSLAVPGGPELKIEVDAISGVADTGDLDTDLVELFVSLGEAAQEANNLICFFIDEVQYLSEKAVGGLIAASHRITQKSLPVVFICAGLPQIAALTGDAKSYAERLFEFVPIGPLRQGADQEALCGPARERGVELSDPATSTLLTESRGYPYFIQEFGKHAWNLAASSPITDEDAINASISATEALDVSFFKTRMERATTAERNFMMGMAALGSGPYATSDVATRIGKKVSSVGPVRAQLIRKGFVYSPEHGQVEFTVPLFDEYMRRIQNL